MPKRCSGPTIDTAMPSVPSTGSARLMAVMSSSIAPVRSTTRPGLRSAEPRAEFSRGTSWPTQPTWRIARGLSAAAT
jgi:hypothetical protein